MLDKLKVLFSELTRIQIVAICAMVIVFLFVLSILSRL